MLGEQSMASKARRKRRDGGAQASLEISRLGDGEDEANEDEDGQASSSKKNVDDLLPIGVSLSYAVSKQSNITPQRLPAPPPARKQFKAQNRKEWAHVVDVNQELTNVSPQSLVY
jgi:antiviral helicase SKI2